MKDFKYFQISWKIQVSCIDKTEPWKVLDHSFIYYVQYKRQFLIDFLYYIVFWLEP